MPVSGSVAGVHANRRSRSIRPSTRRSRAVMREDGAYSTFIGFEGHGTKANGLDFAVILNQFPHPEKAFAGDVIGEAFALEIVHVHHAGHVHLLEVLHALDLLCFQLGAGEGRQYKGRQNADDRDHDHQLDQGEGLPRVIRQTLGGLV